MAAGTSENLHVARTRWQSPNVGDPYHTLSGARNAKMNQAGYLKIDNETTAEYTRNPGRLDGKVLERLAQQDGHLDAAQRHELVKGLLDHPRPWRFSRFIKELAEVDPYAVEVNDENENFTYSVKVLNDNVESVMGKIWVEKGAEAEAEFGRHGHLSDVETDGANACFGLSNCMPSIRANGSRERPLSNPVERWSDFWLWKKLLSTNLINLLPDASFSLFVFAKDRTGDDLPIFFMELQKRPKDEAQTKKRTPRYELIWELDQVLRSNNDRIARPREALHAAEFASAYQKIFFYVNWFDDFGTKRHITHALVSDLNRVSKDKWDDWFEERHKDDPTDAILAIIITIVAAILSFSTVLDQPVISIVAGIAVAGIASEEWIPPRAFLLGAVARFHGNESLSLRVYQRADRMLSTKTVFISLIASFAEISDVFFFWQGNTDRSNDDCIIANQTILGVPVNCTTDEPASNFLNIMHPQGDACCAMNRSDLTISIAACFNCILLMHTAFAGIYSLYSPSDFPKNPRQHPRVYVEKASQKGFQKFFRQSIRDLRAVRERCYVYSPLNHFALTDDEIGSGRSQLAFKNINGQVEDFVDLASPGAPSGYLCYWISSPACSKIAVDCLVYGKYCSLYLLPLALIEQILGIVGGLLTIIFDIPVALLLLLLAAPMQLNKIKRDTVPRPFIRNCVAAIMYVYEPVDWYLILVRSYNRIIAALLDLDYIKCRTRSTARLYRWANIRAVRTGRASNHSWSFGEHLDSGYYHCSDCVCVNPRTFKMGLVNKEIRAFQRHRNLWANHPNIKVYKNPFLSCGDNTEIIPKKSANNETEVLKADEEAKRPALDREDDGSDSEDDPVNDNEDIPRLFRRKRVVDSHD
ncbi:Hypothetical Protein FCC1311_085632 [Hondaea fermentalgiana]|uniref:Uncharacterized protein n=1 Tax=Hondaea fermentalgiana TaxID=2315210 RepID=A0A2R5GRE8_9STRA|nr:Hypothetical Protein FCC1311_085632 [Hondaea fermentalgiana]|eukprot:GBG32338.1 Hypothetical Protein FCC1311_085632 [Hondaea fermentalgiana]